MSLNFTTEVYLSIVSVLLSLVSAGLILNQHRKKKDRALVLLAIAYMNLAGFFLFSGLSYLLLNTTFFMLKNVFLVLLVLFITMAVTQMMSGEMITLALVVVTFFSSSGIFVFLLPNNVESLVYDNGEMSLKHIGYNRLIISILFLYVILAILYFSVKIYLHSPNEFRKDTRLFLLGNFILLFSLGSFSSELASMIPGIVEFFVSFGILVTSIGLIRAPEILYLLPFKAIKLSIINSKSGINIFNHHWMESIEENNDQLFSAAFVAITNFINDTLGNETHSPLQEVKLEDTTIIVKKPEVQPVYYVVIATKSSYTLRKGLDQFAYQFYKRYKEDLKDESGNIERYKDAEDIISNCFPYIPGEEARN